MKTTSATLMLCVALSSVVVTPAANAVIPILPIATGAPLSDYWTFPRLFKQYFDWRSSAGWGAIGAGNVAITLASQGTNNGAFTKSLFSDLCGTVASGLVANWKPASEPSAAGNMKAVVKGGVTVAAASACGWATEWGISIMNREIPRAQAAINHARTNNPANYKEIVADTTKVTIYQNNMEKNYRDIGQFDRKARIAMNLFRTSGCKFASDNDVCNEHYSEYVSFKSSSRQALVNFNKNAILMDNNLQELGDDVKS